MAEDIAVPAEVVRQIATEAADEVHYHRQEGRKAYARSLEDDIAEAFAALEGKDGEFVSIDGSVVSALTAEAVIEAPDYAEAARTFLKQYNVW
jgi:hypothetical protein